MKNAGFKIFLVLVCCFALCALSFEIVSAYELLQPLPEGAGEIVETGLSDYLTWLYRFALGAAIFLAVLKIVIGGIYIIVGGASETAHSKGREMIEMALWGLLLAVSAWLLLNTINPDFVTGKFGISPATIESKLPPATPTPPPTEFNNTVSPELSGFISCIKNSVPGLIITSRTDDNIALGLCNPTDPSESFNDPNNCQHAKNSCHYGGSSSSCVSKGSYAIDVSPSSYATVAGAAAGCGGVLGNYSTTAKCKNEGDHYHISIGAWYGCGCDTGMASCASQK